MPNKPARELEHCRLNSVFFLLCAVTQLTQHDDEWRRLRESRELTKSIHIFTERIRNWTCTRAFIGPARARTTLEFPMWTLSLRRDDVGSVGSDCFRYAINSMHYIVAWSVVCFSRETESRVIGCLFANLVSRQLYFYDIYYCTECSGFLLDRTDLLCVRFSLFHHLRLELEAAEQQSQFTRGISNISQSSFSSFFSPPHR